MVAATYGRLKRAINRRPTTLIRVPQLGFVPEETRGEEDFKRHISRLSIIIIDKSEIVPFRQVKVPKRRELDKNIA